MLVYYCIYEATCICVTHTFTFTDVVKIMHEDYTMFNDVKVAQWNFSSVAGYGVPLCQNLEYYELELKCWYLRNCLVFTYWYLCTILVFKHHTGIYA